MRVRIPGGDVPVEVDIAFVPLVRGSALLLDVCHGVQRGEKRRERTTTAQKSTPFL